MPDEGCMHLVGQHGDPGRGPEHGRRLAFMNYVYDPVNQAPIAAYISYVTPVAGVQGDLREGRIRSSPRTS